jgi:hypothetical protein
MAFVALAWSATVSGDPSGPVPAAKLEHSTSVLVTDGEGRPIKGATITSTDFSEKWLFPVPTDEKGIAKLAWPHYSPGFSANVLIDHPDFILERGNVPIGAELLPISLRKGSVVQLMARLPGEDGAARDLTPDFGSQRGISWSEDEGLLSIGRLDLAPGGPGYRMRLVHLSDQGSCFFSDVIDLRQVSAELRPPTFPLRQGRKFRGRLSEEVSRPVVRGTVYAVSRSSTQEFTPTPWSRIVAIDPDGEFVIDSLPPDERTVEILVFCQGWMSAAPTEQEERETEAAFPQGQRYNRDSTTAAVFRRFKLPDDGEGPAPIAIPMIRTATARIRVVDPEGSPLAGAQVEATTTQRLPGTDGHFLGATIDSVAALRRRRTGETGARLLPDPIRFEAITDSKGDADLHELPVGIFKGRPALRLSLTAKHPDWKQTSISMILSPEPYASTIKMKIRVDDSKK